MAENRSQEEQALVLRAQCGDRTAFEALMAATLAQSWALAWRLTGNQADAEDLVQETYLKAWLAIKKFRGQSGFATWLYRIELNHHSDGRRKEKIRRMVSLETGPATDDKPQIQVPDPEPGTPAKLESAERTASLRKILDSLDPAYRQILILRELEDLSYEAISAALNIPVGTVAAWLFRARAAFREAYQQFSGEKL